MASPNFTVIPFLVLFHPITYLECVNVKFR